MAGSCRFRLPGSQNDPVFKPDGKSSQLILSIRQRGPAGAAGKRSTSTQSGGDPPRQLPHREKTPGLSPPRRFYVPIKYPSSRYDDAADRFAVVSQVFQPKQVRVPADGTDLDPYRGGSAFPGPGAEL